MTAVSHILNQRHITRSVDAFLHVGSFHVHVGRLTAFAHSVALHRFKVGVGCVVPHFGHFEVRCCLFVQLEGFLGTFGFVGGEVAEERSYVVSFVPFNFF